MRIFIAVFFFCLCIWIITGGAKVIQRSINSYYATPDTTITIKNGKPDTVIVIKKQPNCLK